ncbi:MAG: TlpA disulfide reductase family protein [Flavobacteriaceae bacterium]
MKYLLFFASIFLFIACNKESNTYTLKGSAMGFQDGTQVFLYQIDQNNQTKVIDTLVINNQQFEEKFPKMEGTTLQLLKVENSSNNIVFFVENENLSAQLYADSIAASYVTGGRQNELYNEFTKTVKGFVAEKIALNKEFQTAQVAQDQEQMQALRQQNLAIAAKEKDYKRNFVMSNTNSLFSMMLLSELFQQKEFTAEEATEILGKLTPSMATNPVVVQLKNNIEAAKKADIGGVAPNFEAPTPSGDMLSLNETLGKYTIIDFWASWCRPCRMENPNVVKVYEKYHDKGLNIISVSLDREGQKDRWIQAIEDDKMDWYHVSNLMFWQDPIAQQYNIRSIPATFLLDEKGNIIDKNLRGPALEARIAKLLD